LDVSNIRIGSKNYWTPIFNFIRNSESILHLNFANTQFTD